MTVAELNAMVGLNFDATKEEMAQAIQTMASVRQLFESSEWELKLNEMGSSR